MKAIDPHTDKLVDLLKVQLGNVYIQVDPLNQEDVQFTIDFLSHFIQNIREKERRIEKEVKA